MEKKILNLQLFAEEAAAENSAETMAEQGKTTDGKEPVTVDEPKKNAEPKYTDADVDKIIGKKFAEWAKQQEKKTTEAERLGKMTAEEKANERIKALEEKLAAAELKETRAAMAKEARAILQGANIVVNDELLSNLVADSADTTKAAVENFIQLFNDAVEKKVKEAYKGVTPKKGGAASLTKEQILAVQNRAERQRLISENIHLFK